MHWVKLEFKETSPSSSQIGLPDCPTVLVEKQDNISEHIPTTVRNVLGQDVVYSPKLPDTDTTFLGIDFPSNISLGSWLQRRISMPARRPFLNSGQQAPRALPSTLPPTYEDAVPAIKWLNLLGERWKWKASAIVLSRFRDLFLARVAMRWVVRIGQYFLGPTALWLSPSSLTLFWATDLLVFRKARLGRFSCLVALSSFPFLFPGYSIWTGCAIDFLLSMGCMWVGAQVDGRFLTPEETEELERAMVIEEFWIGLLRHLFNKWGLPTYALDQRLAVLSNQSGNQ